MKTFAVKTITSVTLSCLLLSMISFAPREAEAVVPVSVVGTVLQGPVNTIKDNTVTIAGILRDLWNKEYVADPANWASSTDAARKITARMVKHVNSGFDGSPIFVRSLNDFMQSIQDQVAYQMIYSDNLTDLSDELEFQVRVSLADYYNQDRSFKPKSKLDEITDGQSTEFYNGTYTGDNYMEAWYALTVEGEYDDPIQAVNNTINQLDAQRRNIIDNEVNNQLIWSEGVMVTRHCEQAQTSTGGTERRCYNVTPGTLVKEALNFTLGQLPAQVLINQDEINEGVEGVFSGLSAQIVDGQNGLLGLGASPLSVNTFGSSGNRSYLDELAQNTGATAVNPTDNPIQESLDAEIVFSNMQQQILGEITRIEGLLATSSDRFPECFNLSLSSELTEANETASSSLQSSQTVVEILTILKDAYLSATDQASANLVMEQYNNLKVQGIFTTELANNDFKNNYLNVDFKNMIDTFERVIANKLVQCIQEEERNNTSSSNNTSLNNTR